MANGHFMQIILDKKERASEPLLMCLKTCIKILSMVFKISYRMRMLTQKYRFKSRKSRI